MSAVVAVIVGTRPEAIKLAPVVLALRQRGVSVRIVATGQHRDLLHGALAAFDLRADVDLLTMRVGQDLAGSTARLVEALSQALQELRPTFALVQGDATSTLAGALVCFYLGIPCGHVEAGLRSGSLHAPWPEEMNRRLTDRLCTHHYPPTERARRNLLDDGIDPANTIMTGQTGVDAALLISERMDGAVPPEIAGVVRGGQELLVYATAHRRESFDGKIRDVAAALHSIVRERPDVRVVLPAHPNPNVRREIAGFVGTHDRLHIIDPVSYSCSIWLMRHAAAIVSDSGGIQEEAPSFGVPVLVTREVTERPEGVDAGFLRLVGTGAESVSQHLRAVLEDRGLKQRLRGVPNPYGDGHASRRIADDVARIVGVPPRR